MIMIDVILSLLYGFSVINQLSIHTVIKTDEATSIEMHYVLATTTITTTSTSTTIPTSTTTNYCCC
jgi:hypothetical protein